MNIPPSTPRELDHFETALLGELKEHLASRPVRQPAPGQHHHRRRWALGLGAAAAATAYVLVSAGGPAATPAHAVSESADGDVVVTVHRLEDSAGLERALAGHGIDADVSFAPVTEEDGSTTYEMPGSLERGGSVDPAQPTMPGEVPDLPDCGNGEAEPATLARSGDDWVLRIPADSPAQDRQVVISTAADGGLMVAFAAEQPGAYCAFMSTGGTS